MSFFGKYGHIKFRFGIDYGLNADTTAVISSSTVTDGGSTTTSNVNFTVTFSRPVTGFILGDVLANSGTLNNFSADSTTVYTFQLQSPTPGTVTVNVPVNAAQDGAEQPNDAASQYDFTFLLNDISGTISGTRTSETWVGSVEFASNIIIPNGVVVLVDPNCYINSNGFTIIVQNGGYLDTQGKRLPRKSAIGSQIIFS